nr:transmembrane and immunoglobulin domain-containing protein 2 isoform X2 [Castor canadensis]
MGFPDWVLVLLVHFWALQGARNLSVQQWPTTVRAKQGTQVTLACHMTQAQAWERLRVEWMKDSDILCQLFGINGSLSSGACGAQGRLSWQAPGRLTLQLDHVRANDSGNYVCWVTVEIPELDKAKGNGTQLLVEADGPQLNTASSFSGLFLALLVAGTLAVAAVALGAGVWARRRCGQEDSGNPLYCNVLYRPRGTPKRSEAWSGEGKSLNSPKENQRDQSVYSTSFPQPVPCQPRLVPKASPRPGHPIPTVRISPGPGSSG